MDGSLQHQQNLRFTKLTFIVLAAQDNTIETLAPLMRQVAAALQKSAAGSLVRVGS